MRLPALELDYAAPPRRRDLPGIVLLAAASAVAALLATSYRETQIELERAQAAQSLLGAERRPAPAKPRADEVRNAEAVVRQLALPWAQMVRAIERAAMADVALLQMQPDARERALRLVAEAPGEREMLAFVRRLAASNALVDVHLAGHQVLLDEPRRPLQFTVLARLREAR